MALTAATVIVTMILLVLAWGAIEWLTVIAGWQ